MKTTSNGRRRFAVLRRSYLTLLETLIAMALLSLLLVFVFGFFRELSTLTRLSDQTQRESFQMRYLESRLGFIFERIVNENAKDRTFYFYTQPAQEGVSLFPSLVFTFNNEVRQDPSFSGDVLGRLYLDLEQQLSLAIWPLHLPEPHLHLHQEVLCERVLSFNCLFYAAPRHADAGGGKEIDPEKTGPQGNSWHEGEWPLSYAEMPSIVKLILEVAPEPAETQKGAEARELVFTFVLPSSRHPIHYPSD